MNKENPSGPEPVLADGGELNDLKAFFITRGKTLAIGVGIALVVMAGVSITRSRAQSSLREASRLLDSARTPQDLESLLQRYPSSPATPLALLDLAKTHYDAGAFDLALARYDEFSRKHPGHALALVAELGRVHALEASGRTAEAMQGFLSFARAHPMSFLAPEASLGEARCLEEMGRLEEARTRYEDFIAANSQSPWRRRAEVEMQSLKRKATAAQATRPVAPAAAAQP